MKDPLCQWQAAVLIGVILKEERETAG